MPHRAPPPLPATRATSSGEMSIVGRTSDVGVVELDMLPFSGALPTAIMLPFSRPVFLEGAPVFGSDGMLLFCGPVRSCFREWDTVFFLVAIRLTSPPQKVSAWR